MKTAVKIALVLFCINYSLAFQTGSNTGIKVHFDKSFYVSEEIIRFKIYEENISNLPANNNTGIAACYLYSANSETPIEIEKLEVIKGKAEGYLNLPEITEDTYYTFVVYYNRNVYFCEVPVYSREVKKLTTPLGKSGSEDPTVRGQGPLQIKLMGNKHRYSPREKVTFSVSVPQVRREFTFLSVSVHEKTSYLPKTLESFNLKKRKSEFVPSNNVKGRVYSSTDSSLLTNKLICSYFPNNKAVSSAYSDAEGRITLNLEHITGTDKLYLQAYEEVTKRTGEAYIVVENEGKPGPTIFDKKVPQRTPQIEDYIRKKLVRDKVNQIYGLGKQTENSNSIFSIRPYVLSTNFDEYLTMASVRDACREFVPNMTIRRNRKTKKDELFIIKWGVGFPFKQTPVFFINGIPTLSSDTILNLEYKSIETVDVHAAVQTLADFWQMGANGIFSVTLKDGYKNPLEKLPDNWPVVKSIQKPVPFNPNAITDPDVPFLRSSLYWDPLLTVNGIEETTVEFYCSDDITEYIIEIFAITESGETGYLVDYLGIETTSN